MLTNLLSLPGRQDIPESGREGLQYGKSVTDGTLSPYLSPINDHQRIWPYDRTLTIHSVACISWDTTVTLLNRLREGVRARRARLQAIASQTDGVHV